MITDEAGARVVFRPDRVYLGWQHARPVAEPGPRPAGPPEPWADAEAGDGWLAAQRREEARLARPHRRAGAWAAAGACAVAAAWAAGLVSGGLALLGGAGLLSVAAGSVRVIWRSERELRDRVAAESERRAGFRAAAEREAAAGQAVYRREVRAWREHREVFERQPQWFPVALPGGIHRVDVAGGTLAGWSALLTSVAVPRLAAGGEVTVLDLTEGGVAGDLLALARGSGIDPLVWVLPSDLPRLDLGAGLAGEELADVLAVTAAGSGEPGPAADLAADAALLSRVLGALDLGAPDLGALDLGAPGGRAGIGPLTAGLRALAQVGDPRADVRAGLLTPDQVDRLTGLFGRGAERVVTDRAFALEARLRVLAPLGTGPAELPPSRLRLAWLDRRSAALGHQVLACYLTAALTHELRQAPPGRPWQQTLFVLGAERLRGDMLDRLADACETARTGLVLGYRSLPAHVRERLGRGSAAVAFMRLGNAGDARAAAEQIGTEHRFVVSQLTQTVGTSVTATTGDSYTSTVGTADSVSDSVSLTDTAGRSRGRGSSYASTFAPLTPQTGSVSRDASRSQARSDSVALTAGINASTAWGWSTSRALGASDSLAAGAQRTRELLVEQHELQQLPASAVLLTYAGPGGRRVVLADANPAIVGLPTATPLTLDEALARLRRAGGAGAWPRA
jgi:hypothetical protein